MEKDMCGYEKSAHLYDLFDTKNNVDFFLHYAARLGDVLDVGAGTGRIAMPLAERGVQVTCVEPSSAMRHRFRQKLERRPQLDNLIRLVPGDAASFELGRAFPAVFLSGTFDHFLDRRERLESLQNVVRHLVPGGILIFDVFLGLMASAPLSPAGWIQNGDRVYRRLVGRQTLPEQRMRVELVFEVYRNRELVERIEEGSIVGITNRDEIHDLLSQIDCPVRHEFSDYDFTPYREGDDLLIVEAVNQPRSGGGRGA